MRADLNQADLTYWQSIFPLPWPVLELPRDLSRTAGQAPAMQRQELRLESALAAALREYSQQCGSDLFTTLCAAYAATLARLSGAGEVVIAVPAADLPAAAAGGSAAGEAALLPLRLAVDLDAAPAALLASAARTLHEAAAHRGCDIAAIREAVLGPQGGAPLAHVAFGMSPRPAEDGREAFELALQALPEDEGIRLVLDHDAAMFGPESARRWLLLYRQLLEGLASAADQPVAALLAPVDEERQMLARFNASGGDFDRLARLEAIFDAQSERTPDATALVAGGERLSYRELQQRAFGVAAELHRRGVQPGDLVGLSCGRNARMLVGLYGILKAGAGYVPLDPAFPAERLDFMTEDAGLELVLSDRSVDGGWAPQGAERLLLDELAPADGFEPDAAAHSELPAYVIYTSGSTGKPKGVRVPHRSVVNFLQSVGAEPGLAPADRLLAVTTLSFDIAVLELMLPLTRGAQVVIAPREDTNNGAALARLIAEHGIGVMQATPSTWYLLLEAGWQAPAGFRALCGGEPLPPALAERLLAQGVELWNMYGPTETTVWSSAHRVDSPTAPIPIGRPLLNTQFHVLDAAMRPLPLGAVGELWIGGDGVTLGYLNRPELTESRFVADPFSQAPGALLYRTGDLGRWRADGRLECLGRIDNQIKLRGYRIELGEIEFQLAQHPEVRAAVTMVREDRPGDVRLVAYLQPRDAMPAVGALREHLAASLPPYMIPQHFVPLAAIPLLPNGKIDRKSLPVPGSARPELATPYQSPVGELESACCEIFARVLGLDRVGRHDNFFELGGTSLSAMQVVEALSEVAGRRVSAPTIFAHPAPAALVAALSGDAAAPARRRRARATSEDEHAIAVIGMAGRFPGASTVEGFWDNLIAGRETVTRFSLDTLDPAVPEALRADPNYVWARGVIEDVEMFDASFFGIPAREAEAMDPQHRVVLELAWECLERAGYAPDRVDCPVGVFAGAYTPSYLQNSVLTHPEVVERLGEFQVMICNDKDYVATRVAHKLNLKGPAIAVNTACSTSLVAVAQAVDSLRLGRCDMALAGASTVTSPPRSGYLYQEGAMLSDDGCTRTFDADAKGTVFCDGAALVLLKRLSDAIEDGDPIYAVIRGAATNNDGGHKASFTAPSIDGQAEVIAAAHEDAGIDPRTISYVEAHGTATPLGDPVEIEGLTRAFRRATPDTGFCRIGSVKSNVGHLVTAAGTAGLIKTALALSHEQIPATLHFKRPNPKIDIGNTPFVVNAELTPWPRGEAPRRAGVSSFGVGGTNAHVVLEEPPLPEPSSPAAGPQLLRLSARTPTALETMARQLADHLEAHPQLNLADVAHTLRVGRSAFAHRLCVAGDSVGRVVQALRSADDPQRTARALGAAVPPLVWLFPGQGAQYAGMGRGLYESDSAFRAAFDEALAALQLWLEFDLRARMFGDEPDALVATGTTQPATFCLEYALAQAWMARGVRPAALVGHSVGEFAAAVIAGVMSLGDAARLVARRGAMMQALPGGSMLSVRLPREKVLELLPEGLSLAAENGPSACVAAGPTLLVQAWREKLEAEGVMARELQTSHAFHSTMMDPVVEPFEAEVRTVALSAPQIPIVSTLTGDWMRPEDATDPHYWARHLREPVLFSTALRRVQERHDAAFLELGPRGTLATLARQHAARGKGAPVAVASLGDAPQDEAIRLALAQGQLWTLGIELTAPPAEPGERRCRVLLPTYPFERKRHWIDAAPATARTPAPAAKPAPALAPPAAAAPPQPETAPAAAVASRQSRFVTRLRELFEDVSGLDLAEADPAASFIELGLDSLTLTQAALQVRRQFDVQITFRQLMEKVPNLGALAAFLDANTPPDPVPAPAPAAPLLAPAVPGAATAPAAALPATAAVPPATGAAPDTNALLQQLIQQQMQLMAQQLSMLSGLPVAVPAVAQPAVASALPAPAAPQPVSAPAPRPELTLAQRRWLDDFVARYGVRTGRSLAFARKHRRLLADPRPVAGFDPLWKELLHPVVVNRSSGARLWDLDGNEYIDLLASFGANLLGYQPSEVVDAMTGQLLAGIEVGPQHPLAAELAQLVSEFTGLERVAFCGSGAEAVAGALRLARAVSGRRTVAVFANAWHGLSDEAVVHASEPQPAAPALAAAAGEVTLVLEFGSEAALRLLRERGHELAAILVEPIPGQTGVMRPHEFVRALRRIADEAGCALVFDEVLTGFRVAPGGAQEFYGVRADIAAYGRALGGGMPLAAIAGAPRWLDALDGGSWQSGDAGGFAGPFVRHPLALAAARATLLHLKRGGRELYRLLNERTQRLVERLNTAFAVRGAPVRAVHHASLWRLQWDANQPFAGLFYALARFHGLHLYEPFGHFVTEAMGEAELDRIFEVFTKSLDELMLQGFVTPREGSTPPPSGGRDRSAHPTEGPLSPGQTEHWLAAGFDGSVRRALNESCYLSLAGPVDLVALRAALQDVLARHEAFRVYFSTEEPRQMLAAPGPVAVTELDLSGEPDAEAALRDFCREASTRDFALDRAPLAEVSLLRLADGRAVVHIVASHLICDGWGFSVFTGEIAAAYRARSTGMPPALPSAESPLAFAAQELERMDGAAGQESLAYWQRLLKDPPAPLALGDRTPPAQRTYVGDTLKARIDGAHWSGLRAQLRQAAATPMQWLLTALTLTLYRRSGQREFLVSIPCASQSLERHGPLIADGVLDLPLRLGCGETDTAADVLARVRTRLMDALEHPVATQGGIARALGIRSSGDRPPLTGIFFNLNPKADLSGFAPLAATLHQGPKRGLLNQLFFDFHEHEDALTLDLHYSTEFFSPKCVQELVEALRETVLTLGGVLDAPVGRATAPSAPAVAAEAAVSAPAGAGTAPAEAAAAVDARLWQWNATATPLEARPRVEQWIARQAARTPAQPAVSARGTTLSYAELEARANRYANLLRSRGVDAGMRVGLCLSRGPELLPALLGVLKTGAAYVPLDPGFPRERLQYMAEDAAVKLVVTEVQHAELAGVPREQQLRVDEDAAEIAAMPDTAPEASPDWPADATTYVIYTSGSTGKPKGVVLPQRAVCNFLASMQRSPGIRSDDRLLAVTTLSFDIAVLELMLPLTVGAQVVIAQREETMDGEVLARLIAGHGITMMQATPTTWHLLLDAGWKAPKHFRALCGGEPLPPSLAERLLAQGVELWNMYGPTETTVWSTLARITDAQQRITVGRPIDNTQVWILDEKLQPCPVGAEGEICIGGTGVATGYHNRPELTAERFVADPLSMEPGARIYRTGDLGRWREDGRIEHLGRLDFQVKIRGYRIELGEIEARLAALPGVARTVVTAREDQPGDVRLVAYFVPQAGQAPEPAALREALRGVLPDYMLPQFVVPLDAMPLLPNGKIDRKALPAPSAPALPAAGSEPKLMPRNEIERTVAAAMQAVLKLPQVGAQDDFFALGGHSLLAARLVGQINRELGVQLSLRTLFEAPTVERLASVVVQLRDGDAPRRAPIVRRERQDVAPLTVMQERIRFIEEMHPGTLSYNMPSCHRLRGPMDLAALDRAFGETMRRQGMLRTSIVRGPQGPVQRVDDALAFSLLPLVDLSALPEGEREEELMRQLDPLLDRSLALEQGPLFVARLFRLADEHHVLFFMPHHIVWDGSSFDIFQAEMAALYEAFAAGRPSPLPALPVSYGDFAQWHREWLASEEIAQQLKYWKSQFALAPLPSAPPTDLPRGRSNTGRGGCEYLPMPADQAERLRELAKQTGSTLSIVALSVYAALMSQWLREPMPSIGMPVRGRPAPELDPVMGFFNNMVPMRMPVDTTLSCLDWIGAVRHKLTEVFANQDVPFELLATELGGQRKGVLYQVMFTFQDIRLRPAQWGSLAHEPVTLMYRGATEDLNLWMHEHRDGILGGLQYNADLYMSATVAGLRDRLAAMFERLLENPGQTVGELLASTQPEPQPASAGTVRATASDDFLDAIAERARRAPHGTALHDGARTLARGELERRMQACETLLAARAVPAGACVALAIDDPLAQIVAGLAVLRSGRRCIPLDAPASAASLRAAGVDALIADAPALALVPAGIATIGAHELPGCASITEPARAVPAAAPAAVGRAELARQVAELSQELQLFETDRVLSLDGRSRALQLLEACVALAAGAALVLAPAALMEQPGELLTRIRAERIGALHAPARCWQRLLAAAGNEPLQLVAVLDVTESDPDLVAALFESGCTVLSVYRAPALQTPVAAGWLSGAQDSALFGRPLLPEAMCIGDRPGEPAPAGVSAPLWVSAGGDWADSGSLCRWRPDGMLQYLGESGEAVHVNGCRVDLTVLEAQLRGIPGVAAAAAVLREEPAEHRVLTLLVQPRQPGADIAPAVLDALRQVQPRLAAACRVVPVAAIEHGADGRPDPVRSAPLAAPAAPVADASTASRAATVQPAAAPLPAPTAPAAPAVSASVAAPASATAVADPAMPATPTERVLAEVWSELLGLQGVRRHDNFFELGGTSLLAMQVAMRLEQRLGQQVSARRFVFETLAQLAAAYDEAAGAAPQPAAEAGPPQQGQQGQEEAAAPQAAGGVLGRLARMVFRG